jgi:GTP-binding protein HflX
VDHPAEGHPRVWLSARDGLGLDLLRGAIGGALELRHVVGSIELPAGAGRLRARLHELGAVVDEQAGDDGWRLQLDLAEVDARRLYAQAHGEALRPLLDGAELDRALSGEHDFGVDRV